MFGCCRVPHVFHWHAIIAWGVNNDEASRLDYLARLAFDFASIPEAQIPPPGNWGGIMWVPELDANRAVIGYHRLGTQPADTDLIANLGLIESRTFYSVPAMTDWAWLNQPPYPWPAVEPHTTVRSFAGSPQGQCGSNYEWIGARIKLWTAGRLWWARRAYAECMRTDAPVPYANLGPVETAIELPLPPWNPDWSQGGAPGSYAFYPADIICGHRNTLCSDAP